MARQKTFKHKILYTVLAVVLIPIVLECFLFWKLYSLAEEAEALTRMEQKQSAIIDHINQSITLFANITGHMGTYIVNGYTNHQDDAHGLIRQLQSEFDWMGIALKDDPQANQHFLETREMLNAQLEMLQSLKPEKQDIGYVSLIDKVKNMRTFLATVGKTNKFVLQNMEQQRAKLEQTRAEHQKNSQQWKQFVLFGVLGNVLFAVIAAFLLVRNITSRLNILVDNAYRVPRGIPLEQRVSGADEFSYLDEILHEAEGYLRDNAEHRRFIMEMVTHDMRSPLMSAQIALEILSERSDHPQALVQR
ncbi:MAG: hypothetical protein ACRD3W_04060, partial [Terriglobales bacterium]